MRRCVVVTYLFFESEERLDQATRHLRRRVMERARSERRHDRRPLTYRFAVYTPHTNEPYVLESVDISPTGVFLASDTPLDQGEDVRLEYTSPVTERAVRLCGRVTRFTNAADSHCGRSGVALEFVDVSDEQWDDLCQLVFGNVGRTEQDDLLGAFSFQTFAPAALAPASSHDDGFWLWSGISP